MRRAGTSAHAPTTHRHRLRHRPGQEADAENPVYYVQYAHARCSSILRQPADAGRWRGCRRRVRAPAPPRRAGAHPPPAGLPEVVADAAERRETHELTALRPGGRAACSASSTATAGCCPMTPPDRSRGAPGADRCHAPGAGQQPRPARGLRAGHDVGLAAGRPASAMALEQLG